MGLVALINCQLIEHTVDPKTPAADATGIPSGRCAEVGGIRQIAVQCWKTKDHPARFTVGQRYCQIAYGSTTSNDGCARTGCRGQADFRDCCSIRKQAEWANRHVASMSLISFSGRRSNYSAGYPLVPTP